MDLRQALADAEAELAQAEKQVQDLVNLIGRLKDEKRGLELAVARHNGHATVDPNEWQVLSRPQAILRLLVEIGEAMSPSEINRQFASRGRRDQPRLVSAGLNALKNRGQVQSLGNGKWALVRDDRPKLEGGPADSGPESMEPPDEGVA